MENHSKNISRRTFLKSSTGVTAGITMGLQYYNRPMYGSARRVNEKIRVGFIGVGNRGTKLLRGFLQQDDVEIAALCDVYEPYLFRDYTKVNAWQPRTENDRNPTR